MGKPFRILSIDGGGIRGVYPAHILRCIEERLKINLFETFDMIAGTSTGAIIAAGIASGLNAEILESLYVADGEKIFRKNDFFWFAKKIRSLLSGMFVSAFDNNHLKAVLEKIFGNRCLGEIKKPLILPSTDVGLGCVHVFKSNYSNDFTRDNKVMLRDAVLASCSAPTFFDPHNVGNYFLADGGLWANNPAFVAVIDAQRRLSINREDIKILTVGTGHSKIAYGTDPKRHWGFLSGWRRKEFVNFILSLQSQCAMNYLSLLLKPEQIKRINFETDKTISLDDFSCINDLLNRADHDFTHNSESIRDFLVQ